MVLEHPTEGKKFFRQEEIPQAQRAGWAVPAGAEVVVSTENGPAAIGADQLPSALAGGEQLAGPLEHEAARDKTRRSEVYGDATGQLAAGAAGVARGLTVGGSDVLLSEFGGNETREYLQGVRQENPWTSIVSEIGGAILPAVLSGGSSAPASAGSIAARAAPAAMAARFAKAAGGSSLIRRGVVEGAIFGAGEGVSELALSDDPVNAERFVSVMSSNMLLGGVAGGAGGFASKALEKGLTRAQKALARRAAKAADAAGDATATASKYAEFDMPGLRAAEAAEIDRIGKAKKLQGEELLDELAGPYSAALEEAGNLYAVTAGAESGSKLSKLAADNMRKARRGLKNALQKPKAEAVRPFKVRDALERYEQALLTVQEEQWNIARKAAADAGEAGAAGSARIQQLGHVDDLLESTQRHLETVNEILTPAAKTQTPERAAIREAMDVLRAPAAPAPGPGFAERAGKTVATGAVATALGGSPVAWMASAGIVNKVADLVFKRAGTAAGESAARLEKALEGVLRRSGKGPKFAPVAFTKMLKQVKFADREPQKGESTFQQRAAELRSNLGADGRMSSAARAKVAERLAPVAVGDPVLADQMETIAARKAEFLAGKIPKEPGLGMFDLAGWAPSARDQARFARFVAAAEDPMAVLERVASGSASPEDAETLREVYPEMFRAIQQAIVAELPELRNKLTYERRLMLGVLFGLPVDPSLDPGVFAILQGAFEGAGMISPPSPATANQPADMGAIKPEPPTPAQERAS